jgi:DNA-binding NarL/FixJ family response regulator
MKKLRILLADDHQILREGLRLLIDAQPDMRVIGEAGDGLEVIEQAQALQPDLVVMDLSMPRLNGLQATCRLRTEFPEIKIVTLTVHEDESYLVQLCKAGAAGYVLKRSAGDDLIHAIREVAAGGLAYDPAVTSRALASQVSDTVRVSEPHITDLSPREKEVLTMLAWGHSNKEIAAKLRVSVKTIETYRARIGEKAGLRSRTEMVRFALRAGWLDETRPPPPDRVA